MNAERERIIEELFDRCAVIAPAERDAFLQSRCPDAQARREVETLLRHDREASGPFLAGGPDGDGVGRTSGETVPAAGAAYRGHGHAATDLTGQQVGRYKLLGVLGQGGMGVVYEAEQSHPLRRTVALKVIKPGMDGDPIVARFQSERQALALMDHPNVARILDAGATDDGRPYFVMELVRDGEPITRYCDQHRLTIRQRLALFATVCDAVQHAHQKGIIHRDLKPNNVLVTLQDRKPVPKVIDFGIAKATAGQRLTEQTLFTEFRQLVGTPLYMSPEQAEMSALMDMDTRSDVYSLGVLLYELLTGTTPFDKQRLAKAAYEEVRRIIREEEPPRPSTRISALGATLTSVSARRQTDPKKLSHLLRGELDWIVMRAMEKDRTRRYGTASGLAHDLERYLADQPVEACPPSRIYRLRTFSRRNKAVITTASTIAAILLLATGVSTWQAMRATRERIAALTQQSRADRQATLAQNHADAAERQLQRAEAFNQVMRGILSNVHPTAGSTGRDLRVVDLLNLASHEAEARFKFQPQAEIESRTILAEAYRGLDDGLARDNLSRAYQLSRDLPGGAQSEQTMALAAELARHGDIDFAEKTYDVAVKRFGQWHPVAQRAASGLAMALLMGSPEDTHRPDRTARAEQILQDLVDQSNQSNSSRNSAAPYGYMNDLAFLLNREHKYVKAEHVAREALARAREDKEAGITARANLGWCLVEALTGQRRWTEAADEAEQTLAYDKENIGAFHPTTTRILQMYARLLCRVGKPNEGDRLLEENLRLARDVYHGDDDSKVDRIAYLGHLRFDLENREDALPFLVEAAEMQGRLQGESDVKARLLTREALLVSSGAMRQRADGSIHAQIFCALEDLWRDNPGQTPDPQDLIPSDIRYSLVSWESGGQHELVAHGTLADPSPQVQPGAGLHLLSLEVSTKGGRIMRQAMWVLIANWNVTFYARDEIATAPGDALPAAAPVEVVGKAQPPALALVNGLKDIPEKLAAYLTLSAETSVTLPAGRYRISTSSVDGVRLSVDGRTAINVWSTHRPRRDFCDLDLEAGRHNVRLEYFQEGRRVLLWVRIEPLSPASQAFAASYGGHPLRTLQRAIEEQGESRCAQARATRAGLFAVSGRFKEAADDFAAAADINPGEPLWWQQSALLRLELDDQEGYQDWRTRMLSHVSTDCAVTARSAIVAMLWPGIPSDDEVVRSLLRNADPNSACASDKAIYELAHGIADYRARRYGTAIATLSDASAGRLSAEGKAAAELFRAMALHHRGNTQEASSAFASAQKAIKDLPYAEQIELDATEIQDRLICQLAAREAQPLLGAGPSIVP